VRVAGLITRFRQYTTKTGKPMGFVTLEDLQGEIELTIFPKTWDRVSGLIEVDKIILVDGKVDLMDESQPKILVDSITTDFKLVLPASSPQPSNSQAGPGSWNIPGENAQARKSQAIPDSALDKGSASSTRWVAEGPPESLERQGTDSGLEDSFPPEPDVFPPGWGDMFQDDPSSAGSARSAYVVTPLDLPDSEAKSGCPGSEPASGSTSYSLDTMAGGGGDSSPDRTGISVTTYIHDLGLAAASSQEDPSPEADVITRLTSSGVFRRIPTPAEAAPPETANLGAPLPADLPAGDQPIPELQPVEITRLQANPESDAAGARSLPDHISYILPPPLPREGETIFMITVVFRSTGDKARDVLRMRRTYGIASAYPGEDRLAFQVFERGRGYLVEFPNFTTGWSPELVARLNFLVGSENVRIEPITFH
jgi:hypothetical protein